jgi:hypothetical protein
MNREDDSKNGPFLYNTPEPQGFHVLITFATIRRYSLKHGRLFPAGGSRLALTLRRHNVHFQPIKNKPHKDAVVL